MTINVGLIGCGVVGSGVVELLARNAFDIANRCGEPINLVKVLEIDTKKLDAAGVAADIRVNDINDILDDDDINVIVEVMGGIEPARTYILEAMRRGKNVVTANKDLIAVAGGELLDTAADHGVDFMFEASVGGGIPVIAPLKQSLPGNRLQQVIGIVNGTTNYILTKMSREGSSFTDVLAEAQHLGYAEADPTSDTEGIDAARKITILASIAFNSRLTLDDVYVEGITRITPQDINYGRELGYTIKLLAIAKEIDGSIQVRVHPAFIPNHHPLAAVNGVFNAIFMTGDAVGDVMLYGRGAGKEPTASAVVGDLMEIGRNLKYHSTGRIGCTCYEHKKVLPIDELISKYYIRMTVVDRPGVLATIAGVFGANEVSLATVLQKTAGQAAQLILITHQVKEANLQDSLAVLKALSMVDSIDNVIRVEGDN
ncbi:MAG: homoserine dehydrogenase [Methylocystaceae bacterium]